MRISFVIVLVIFFVSQLYAQSKDEQLIVFSQETDKHFKTTTLAQLEAYCVEKGIDFIQIDTQKGIPQQIHSTPAIVYQNFRGRSIYSSRYAEFSTLKNFIRTSKVVAQEEHSNCKKEVLLWKDGRNQIAISLKITDLTGSIPKNYNVADFRLSIIDGLLEKMNYFNLADEVCLNKTDRLFYLDIHPFCSANNELFVSTELYSKFSCKTPIYSQLNDPIRGNFDEMESIFSKIGVQIQEEIIQQKENSNIGDAFSSISDKIAKVSWEKLDLMLPKQSSKNYDVVEGSFDLSNDWQFKGPIDEDVPIVQFRFMAPLDRYVGEIRELEGTIQLSDQKVLKTGTFTANMKSLTMGMADFDKNVLTKYIKAAKYPTASFTFSDVPAVEKLQLGETNFYTIDGTFELMKKEQIVPVNAQLTPIIDTEGELVLQVSASFQLNVVNDFGIKGPDGPSPAREIMLFDLNFLMQTSNITN